MDTDIIAARSADRARQQHVRAFKAEHGYRVHSKSTAEWYEVSVRKAGGTVIVTCACPGGTYYRNADGSSCCKHAVQVCRRLIRRRAELGEIVAA